MSRLLLICALVVAVLLAGACGLTEVIDDGVPPTPTPPPEVSRPTGGLLRIQGSRPRTLDPAVSQDVSSWQYILQIFSGLVRLNDDLEVVAEIASDWTISQDGRVYTFELRPDARFHDGSPVTAGAFKYSMERVLHPQIRSPVALLYLGDIVGARDRYEGRAEDVSGIRVVDDHTLEITIDAAKPYFLAKLTYPTAFAVDRANVASGDDWFERPNGSGPMKLERWDPDQRIRLVRNDHYYGETLHLDGVEYYFGPDSAMAMYERGELDAIEVGPADIDRAMDPRGPLSAELIETPMLSLWYIGMNTIMEPFDDPLVRQAFVHAADRRRLADVLFRQMQTPANGILPPGIPGYDPKLEGLEFNPQRARELIAKSRYGSVENLPEITFTISAGGGFLGQSFAEMYSRNLGVEISVMEVDRAFFDELTARKYQMFHVGWVADYPDPENFLDILFHSQSDANHSAFADPEVDRLLEAARVERDNERRMDLYRQAEQKVVEAAPIVPLFHDTSYALVKPYVMGLTRTPMGIISYRGVRIDR